MAGSQKASGSENKTIDSSHPLYIHHSDQPGPCFWCHQIKWGQLSIMEQAVIHALIAKKGTVEEPSRRKMNPLCLNSGINATA
ncbi:hypothetical protein CK203_073351 [Vitis vinifera]|uniref:Uncharacterized protein n=1 Tax=Vitis vinifera TaxID=29760 RepID=A0A438ESM9_VITVI|nr:hypothetical protein CK203_073351 [Vitis vinifera]